MKFLSGAARRRIPAAAGFLSAVLLGAALLTSCGSDLVKITYENGRYVDKTNAITYDVAAVSYEPVKVGEEYAQCGKTVLYKIPGLEPTEWLTESYEGVGSVYYADGVTLPALGDFGADLIYICAEDELTMQIGKVDDESAVAGIVSAMTDGEEVDLPQDGTNSYHLKFVSPTYPSLYYDILYIEHDDNNNYLYDRGTKRCVNCGRMLKAYLPSDADMIAAATTAETTGAGS